MRKICIVTGTRAEYGLLHGLINEIDQCSTMQLQLVATAMHLSPEFGMTYKLIEEDGFKIDKKIECLLSSDSPIGISKSLGIAQISFAEAFDELKPDIIVLLGDRTEILAAAIAALVACIPIAHIHGGELTEGVYDDAIRHSVSKMSHLHFTATEEYRNRVIQLGENPDNVFNTGAPGIDNIVNLNFIPKYELEKLLGIKFNKRNICITFHPVTLENLTAEEQFSSLLAALDELQDVNLIFTKPNSDKDSRKIIEMLDRYGSEKENAYVFTSLGHRNYLSLLKCVDMVVGNSSSGIIEAPSMGIPTVNLGDRQRGRVRAKSVIDCETEKDLILKSIKQAFSIEFKEIAKNVENPYGKGDTIMRIFEILKKETEINIKKKFYNLKF